LVELAEKYFRRPWPGFVAQERLLSSSLTKHLRTLQEEFADL
jgi:hypothetical protein